MARLRDLVPQAVVVRPEPGSGNLVRDDWVQRCVHVRLREMGLYPNQGTCYRRSWPQDEAIMSGHRQGEFSPCWSRRRVVAYAMEDEVLKPMMLY